MIEIKLPQIDENVVEYTIGQWLKAAGDVVAIDEAILEVETDKVTMEVSADSAGTLMTLLAEAGDVMRPGEVLARLAPLDQTQENGTEKVATEAQAVPSSQRLKTVPVRREKEARLSPVVARMVAQHDIDVSLIEGTGKSGRVTKGDVQAYLDTAGDRDRDRDGDGGDVVVAERDKAIQPLSGMRRSIAEHMVRSVATSPHVTTLFEFDFGRVAAHRATHKGRLRPMG